MDKLKTELYGGYPFELDDWRWEIDAHRAALGALAQGMPGTDGGALIISGIVPVLNNLGGVVSVSAGWVAWAGELWYFPGGPGVGAVIPDLHYLFTVVAPDPGGNETFQDGTTQNTYERRRVVMFATGQENPSAISVGRTPRLRDRLWPGEWVPITQFTPDFTIYSGVGYRIEASCLRLRGSVEYLGPTGQPTYGGNIFTLPAGARPTGDNFLPGTFSDPGTGLRTFTFYIGPTGICQAGIIPDLIQHAIYHLDLSVPLG